MPTLPSCQSDCIIVNNVRKVADFALSIQNKHNFKNRNTNAKTQVRFIDNEFSLFPTNGMKFHGLTFLSLGGFKVSRAMSQFTKKSQYAAATSTAAECRQSM